MTTDPEPMGDEKEVEIDIRVLMLCRAIDRYYQVWNYFLGDCATRWELEQEETRVMQAKVALTQLLRRADGNAT